MFIIIVLYNGYYITFIYKIDKTCADSIPEVAA